MIVLRIALQTSAAVIAQLGERQTEDLEVLGSIPSPGIIRSTVDGDARGWSYWEMLGYARSNGVTVSTLDFESSDGGSNPP